MLLFVLSRLCSFLGLLISGVDIDGIDKLLNMLRTNSELLLNKSTLICFGSPYFEFVEIDYTELLVLLKYVKDLFESATADIKGFTFDFTLG